MKNQTITLLYDATCAFCNYCRKCIEQRQNAVLFEFRDIEDTAAESIVVDPERLHLTKWRACVYILKSLRFPWPAVGFVSGLVPQMIGDRLYDTVSRNRQFLMKFLK